MDLPVQDHSPGICASFKHRQQSMPLGFFLVSQWWSHLTLQKWIIRKGTGQWKWKCRKNWKVINSGSEILITYEWGLGEIVNWGVGDWHGCCSRGQCLTDFEPNHVTCFGSHEALHTWTEALRAITSFSQPSELSIPCKLQVQTEAAPSVWVLDWKHVEQGHSAQAAQSLCVR